MLPTSGTIYIYEKQPDGSNLVIPVEETPDNLEEQVSQELAKNTQDDPHEELRKIATTPPKPKPKYDDPFGFAQGKPFPDMPFGKGGFNQPKPFGPSGVSSLKSFNRPAAFGKMPFRPQSGFKPFGTTQGKPFGSASTFVPPSGTTADKQGKSFGSAQDKPLNIPLSNPLSPKQVQPPFSPTSTPIPNQAAINLAPPLIPNISEPVVIKPQPLPVNTITPSTNTVSVAKPVTPSPAPVIPYGASAVSGEQAKAAAIEIGPSGGLPTQTPDFKPVIVPAAKGKSGSTLRRNVGMALLFISLGGAFAPMFPKIRLETVYRAQETRRALVSLIAPPKPMPPAAPKVFEPLRTPDGASIDPVNRDFSIIVPSVGINAPVIAGVDPANPGKYQEALQKGVAQAASSFTPDQNGTVYLFSHSTNYDWFVKDLNAVFYMLKNLKTGDLIIVYYKGVRYTYALKETRVVKPNQVSYLVPIEGKKSLILQTCWPPGSVAERLLLFADMVEEHQEQV